MDGRGQRGEERGEMFIRKALRGVSRQQYFRSIPDHLLPAEVLDTADSNTIPHELVPTDSVPDGRHDVCDLIHSSREALQSIVRQQAGVDQ